MKKKINKNNYLRLQYKLVEFEKILCKCLLQNKLSEKKKKILFFQSRLNKPTNFNSICLLTGYSRGVFKHFNVSRYILKTYISVGLVVGFQKHTW
jgi:ribosomal protein S14